MMMFRMMYRLFSVPALCILVAAFTSCHRKDETPTPQPPVKVDVVVVASTDFNASQTFSGTVSSANTTTVSFSIPGTVETLTATEGQSVTKGQILGRLKSGDYRNADNIARAQLDEATDAYNRLKKLHDSNALPEIKWVEIQQKLRQAQNAAEMAARTLGETTLYAPMSGIISRKFVDAGQNVAPIEPVYTIVSTQNLTVEVSIPETEIASLRVGRKATVMLDGLAPIEARVVSKSVVADPLTRSYTAKIDIPAAGGAILPGMVANVVFEAESTTDTPSAEASGKTLLPSQAVNLSDDNRTFVWIVRNGVAEQRFVEADMLVSRGVLITDGLQPADTVIVAGMQKVGRGSKVAPTVLPHDLNQ